MHKQLLAAKLAELDIDCRIAGENVSSDEWIGIDCPACDDDNKHLGVNCQSLQCFCWRCGQRGHLSFILSEYHFLDRNLIEATLDTLPETTPTTLVDTVSALLGGTSITNRGPVKVTAIDPRKYHLQQVTKTNAGTLLRHYLKQRNFTVQDCIRHSVMWTNVGQLAHRLVIPIEDARGVIVGLQGRAARSSMVPRYMSIGPVHDYLYGLLELSDPAITRLLIVEGLFDQWRLGPGTIALLGTQLRFPQIKLLLSATKLRDVILMLDDDAYFKAGQIAIRLNANGFKAKAVRLPPETDPDSLGRDQTLSLIP